MGTRGFWVAVVAGETYEAERPYANETIALEPPAADTRWAGAPPQPGDSIALVVAVDGTPLFGLGVLTGEPARPLVRYTHRVLDDPVPVRTLPVDDLPTRLGEARAGSFVPVAEEEFVSLVAGVGPAHRVDRGRAEWFVSVALPIEAASRAEAVREFWTYVDQLGPRELPAFVWPRGDELAMQAFLLGAQTNLDPEEDDEG